MTQGSIVERPVGCKFVPPVALVAAGLFGLSFGAALFTLSIFKLLSFFIMPSLFFDLLFIGFPLGAFVAARWLPASGASLRVSLWTLQAMMAASVACCLLAKQFDYLRAHLFDIDLAMLVGQIGVFVGLFLPFFAAYGMSEYLAYQYGRSRLGGRMRLVYALALFGAAAAYVFLRAALPALGMARVQLLAFLAIAGTTAALGAGAQARSAALVEALALGSAFFVPGLEDRFLALYKGRGVQSTFDFETRLGCRSVFQRWGQYSLCEILAAPGRIAYYGFYNDMFQWEYSPRMGFTGPSLGAIPILQTEPGSRIAIVGSGGGRQVRLAERLGERSVTAIELEPAVLLAVRSPEYLLSAFDRVYEQPGVDPIRAEARSYFERSSELFDLIYLPSVGGYAQMMIEPGNMVRTLEAHRLLRDHLTTRGTLAIWYPRGLDTKGLLTDQYVRTLRLLGMPTGAYRNQFEWLILARNDPSASAPMADELARLLRLDLAPPGAAGCHPIPHEVPSDSRFAPITDDRPYLAGNVRYILSTSQVATLALLAGGLIAAAGGGAWLGLRRRGDPRIPGRPYAIVGTLAILIGTNFLLVEHSLAVALFRRLFVYDDALALAVVSFLCLTGIGSLGGGLMPRTGLVVLAALGFGVILLAGHQIPPLGVLLAAAPAALATGTFFPALFDRAAANPLAVFALDAIGAGFGAVFATFVPILWGFRALFAITLAVFAATATADALFHRAPAGRD
jgi:SAM-dependent methyltransferase